MHFRRILLSLLLLVAALNSPAWGAKRYALVVGVKTYRPGQPLPQLAYTENDAHELAKTLEAGGYDVTVMTQTQGRILGKEVFAPLSDYIRDQIAAILDNPFLKPDDLVLVALAGHGVKYDLIDADNPQQKTTRFYFCPADADILKVKSANDITDRNRLIDLGELYAALKTCRAGGKLLLVDACRNDPSKPGNSRLASSTLPALPPPPGGSAAFFSCSENQLAFEDRDLQHGVFFHHVIKGLQGDADTSSASRPADSQITIAELSEHVSASTYDFVRNKYNGARQAPELKGEFRLTIPLIELKTLARVTPVPMQPLPPDPPSVAPQAFTNSIGMKLVPIPSGSFTMGSKDGEDDEKPPHQVTISQAFFMQSTEVTQSQWKSVMGTEPWKGFNYVKEGSSYPATVVSWDDAVEFCQKLSQREGKTYRLPTEAEWEYACRAGTTSAYSFGDDASQLGDYAWYTENAWNIGEKYAHEVGRKRANSWGLHDLHGNVSEWCSDWHGQDYYASSPASDPQGPGSGSSRVLRGGSWLYDAIDARSSDRDDFTPDGRGGGRVGFRVVCE
ncbi:SUMF1/EgtB/PvdO family nonheme iron enzyme [Rubinisphaera sp.]|uniref:SUMF1/EgtB/PvdO family nonheme iron enzyme n=1 Tax=Rubinisphaera sp. TaxID=2024857 RepID=UPI0025E29971|nr:SUMF1/EgtB/PvdO family nonheme iron enzyme [Rubinisphaera sp.]|tara:strand:+ start:6054 stop:7736 length:1683 start_codon:yes stop_codon:yes gene_type:complete